MPHRPGTPAEAAYGRRANETGNAGNLVRGIDHVTGQWVWQIVLAAEVHQHDGDLRRLNGADTSINATPPGPFRVASEVTEAGLRPDGGVEQHRMVGCVHNFAAGEAGGVGSQQANPQERSGEVDCASPWQYCRGEGAPGRNSQGYKPARE